MHLKKVPLCMHFATECVTALDLKINTYNGIQKVLLKQIHSIYCSLTVHRTVVALWISMLNKFTGDKENFQFCHWMELSLENPMKAKYLYSHSSSGITQKKREHWVISVQQTGERREGCEYRELRSVCDNYCILKSPREQRAHISVTPQMWKVECMTFKWEQ